MQRPSFTVVLKSGERYDANHLSIVREPRYQPEDAGTSLYGEGCAITFISSGRMTVKPAEDVERVEYRPTGAQHCGDCDGSLWPVIGAGPFANPEPVEEVGATREPIGPLRLHGHP